MGRAQRVTVTIPEEIVAAVDSIARRTKASRSKVIARILDRAGREAQRKALAEGYQAMLVENAAFAESAQPLAAEIWSEYPSDEADGSEGGG